MKRKFPKLEAGVKYRVQYRVSEWEAAWTFLGTYVQDVGGHPAFEVAKDRPLVSISPSWLLEIWEMPRTSEHQVEQLA